MNKRKNPVVIAVIAVLATITVSLLIVVGLVLAGKISFGTAESSKEDKSEKKEVVEQVEKKEKIDSAEQVEINEEAPAETPATTATTMYVANVQNSIYLRSTPEETESNILTTIPVGAQVVWYENTNSTFSKISYSGMTGYVKRDYLSSKKPQKTESGSGNTTIFKYMYVANVENSIYLRSAPQENSNNIITTIPVGTEIGYIESANATFSKINYNGKIGYVKTKYLADYYTNRQNIYLTVCNVKNSIYLRSAPQENSSNIICEIPLGASVRYVSTASNGFYKINYNGLIGYSKSAYLR